MDILKKATVDHLAAAVIKVAQSFDNGEDLGRLYTPWDELKKNEDSGPILDMEEWYRMNKMPLPRPIGTVIPQSMFVYTDYTEKEIVKINQRKGYMAMEELQGYQRYTAQQMQDAVKDVFANNKSGMMLSAISGWGKSSIYEYFGTMAAQHSLTHKELWMKPGAPTTLAGMRDQGNIREQHIIKFEASNLSQTEGEKGRAEKMFKQLQAIVTDPKYAGIYTFVIDELYTALSSDSSDASEFWELMKSLLDPGDADPYMKVIGTFAIDDLKAFETGVNPRTGKPFYPAQMERRLPLFEMRDLDRTEGMRVLENGYEFLTKKVGLGQQFPEPDYVSLFNAILDKADLATDVSGHVIFGLPERIKKVMSTVANPVRARAKAFEKYTIDQDYMKRYEQYINWGNTAIPKINQEKNEVAQGRNISDQQVKQDIKKISDESGMGEMISIRDLGSKLPHEEIETPESIDSSKKEKIGVLDEAINEISAKLKKIKELYRIKKLTVEQGIAKLKAKYGDIFRPDFKDIGNIKLQDVQGLSQQNLIMAKERKK